MKRLFRFKNISDQNSQLLQRYLNIIFVTSAVPLLLVTLAIYIIGARQIYNLGTEFNQMSMEWLSTDFNTDIQNLETSARYWSYNQLFSAYLEPLKNQGRLSRAEELSRVNTIVNLLSSIESSDSLIARAEIFLAEGYTISPYNSYTKVINADRLEQYQRLFQVPSDLYWYYDLNFNALETKEACVLAQKIPAEASSPIGVMMLRIDQQEMDRLLSQKIVSDKQYACIYLSDGTVLSRGGAGEYKELESLLIQEAQQQENNTFTYSYNGTNVYVSCGTLSSEPWNYLVAMPTTPYLRPMQTLILITLLVLLIVLSLTMIFVRRAAYRLYQPIETLASNYGVKESETELDELVLIENNWKKLVVEKERLQEKYANNQSFMRKELLYQILLGQYRDISERQFSKLLLDVGIRTSGWMCSVVYVRIVNFERSNFSMPEDENLITYATANAIEYLTIDNQSFMHFDVVNFQNLSVAVAVWVADTIGTSMMKKRLIEYCHLIDETLSKTLMFDATVVYGRITTELREIADVFNQVRLTSQLRSGDMESNVLDAEEMVPRREQSVIYPYDLELEIINAIHLDQENICAAQLSKFLEAWANRAPQEAQWLNGCYQLLNNLSNDILRFGYNPLAIYHKSTLVQDMPKTTDPARMREWFWSQVILPYIEEIRSVQDARLRRVVNNVMQIIDVKYQSDLSLDGCAQMQEINPFVLSRAFHKIAGCTFIDYLTNVRLKKAKSMLVTTNLQINEIAEAVGYQPSYFNRVFRKNEGMTPGQYREKYRMGKLNHT